MINRDNLSEHIRFAFNEAQETGAGSLYGAEEWMRICCSRAGRPSSSENGENSSSGGHENGRIKIRPAVVSCWRTGDVLMKCILFYIDKLYGIDIVNKINSMFCYCGVA
jgi:hypothetical protein